ncbi:MAG: methyltransferase domain-containing protein [Legionella sp.]|nr:methyltransferase domain-containing protein [Legionella sp.]
MNDSKGLKINHKHLWHKTLNYDLEHNHTIEGVTKEKLTKLAELAETIEEPYLIGHFNNEQHYLKTLELVLNSTMETRNRIIFFEQEIVPTLFSKECLLDIGPGDGSVTKIFANHFKNITAVDPNLHILHNLQQVLPDNTNYIKINKNILDAELKMETYNLAVLSHILYYIEPENWLKVVKSVYRSLNKKGVLVIVMGGDELGKAELIENFGGQTLVIDTLALDCCNEFGPYDTKLFASNEAFITCSKKAMFHIAAFMLGDANITADKGALNVYIDKALQHSEHYFEMTTRQKYIVIQKKG